MTALSTREALLRALNEHTPVLLSQTAARVVVACKCGPGWDIDRHPTHAEHVAAHLPVVDADTLADDDDLVAELSDGTVGDDSPASVAGVVRTLRNLAAALTERR